MRCQFLANPGSAQVVPRLISTNLWPGPWSLPTAINFPFGPGPRHKRATGKLYSGGSFPFRFLNFWAGNIAAWRVATMIFRWVCPRWWIDPPVSAISPSGKSGKADLWPGAPSRERAARMENPSNICWREEGEVLQVDEKGGLWATRKYVWDDGTFYVPDYSNCGFKNFPLQTCQKSLT